MQEYSLNAILPILYNMKVKNTCNSNENVAVPVMIYVAGVLAFGFLDGITAAIMIEKYGVYAEFNPLMRFVFSTQGFLGFVLFKIFCAAALLLFPLQMHREMKWTSSLFMFAFVIGGSLAALNNAFYIAECRLIMPPMAVIGIFMFCVVCAMEIGNIMDEQPQFKISDEMWEQMKAEMDI